MAFPLIPVALAALAGGTYLQNERAASDERAAADARRRSAFAELDRQDLFREQAAKQLQSNVSNFEAPNLGEKIREAIAVRENAGQSNVRDTRGDFTGFRSDASRVIKNAVDGEKGEGVADSRARVSANARVGGRSDALLGNRIASALTGTDLNTTANLAGGSFGVNQIEQAAEDRNARKGPSLFADLLKAGGQLALIAASGGAGGGGNNIFANLGADATGKRIAASLPPGVTF